MGKYFVNDVCKMQTVCLVDLLTIMLNLSVLFCCLILKADSSVIICCLKKFVSNVVPLFLYIYI